jgi:N-acetyl-beta-hexosaminidase
MLKTGLFILMTCSCAWTEINILPRPEKVDERVGSCAIDVASQVSFQSPERNLGVEGYELEVMETGVVVRAATEAGKFYARQSLQQLIDHAENGNIPCVKITDQPKYAWRSFMIDSGRQYQKVKTIKGLLDRMAMLKLNVFHWHLTENDGWRIEIKKYPKLAEVGGFVADGPEQQGFYTQDEIREIVAYAAERHITVVPEIDVFRRISKAGQERIQSLSLLRRPGGDGQVSVRCS